MTDSISISGNDIEITTFCTYHIEFFIFQIWLTLGTITCRCFSLPTPFPWNQTNFWTLDHQLLANLNWRQNGKWKTKSSYHSDNPFFITNQRGKCNFVHKWYTTHYLRQKQQQYKFVPEKKQYKHLLVFLVQCCLSSAGWRMQFLWDGTGSNLNQSPPSAAHETSNADWILVA